MMDFDKNVNVYISPEGLGVLSNLQKTDNPQENIIWTTDYRIELPVRVQKQGAFSQKPITLNESFLETVQKYGNQPALSEKVNGKWETLNFKEYFENCVNFAGALMDLGIEDCSVNIIGFNAPHWNIAFYGSMFARCVPVGIYTTNSKEVCEFIATQSEGQVVIAQTLALAKNYQDLLIKGIVKYIVLYRQTSLPSNTYEGRIMLWKDFMNRGKRVQKVTVVNKLLTARPGHCCTIVYTSGTTGLPKGVMLSHDNYVFIHKSFLTMLNYQQGVYKERFVSFLPLSHAAAQLADIIVAMRSGAHVFFATPDALQGGLIQTLVEVRPTLFFTVPRVWQKIYDKIMMISKTNGWLKSQIATWVKSFGAQQTLKQKSQLPTSFKYTIAKTFVFNKIKQTLGLDQSRLFLFGAAPLHSDIRKYFLSVGMFLTNSYGMSQCAGPQTLSSSNFMNLNKKDMMREAGLAFNGTQLKIVKAHPNDTDGQICFRGRNVFMGYYKNQQQTSKIIDKDGFLHSGDLGYQDQNGVLFITGRLKQLIITAAGQNIPPLLIQQNIKEALPWVSNVILIGQNRKHLTCLITLVNENNKLSENTLYQFQKANIQVKTLQQCIHNPLVFKLIFAGINKANQKAISRAQTVKSFAILPEDFTPQNGMLTPSLKMKRKEIMKRYETIIQKLYTQSKL